MTESTHDMIRRLMRESSGVTVGHEDMTRGGASYRQIDYWTRIGYLQALDNSGTGHPRRWPLAERDIAGVMHRLVQAGITPAVAHRIARAGGTCELGPGIQVTVQ